MHTVVRPLSVQRWPPLGSLGISAHKISLDVHLFLAPVPRPLPRPRPRPLPPPPPPDAAAGVAAGAAAGGSSSRRGSSSGRHGCEWRATG
eukprot:1184063-Prorocentrum_minimum.AAC.1